MHAWTGWGCFSLLGLHVSLLCPLQQQKSKSQPHPLFPCHLSVLIHAHLSPSLKLGRDVHVEESSRIHAGGSFNTKMSDFKGQMIIFFLNFVPGDYESILPNCFFMLVNQGNPIRHHGCFHSVSSGNVLEYKVLASSRMLTQLWNPSPIKLFCLTTCCLVTSTTGMTSARSDIAYYNNLALITDPICKKFHARLMTRFWMRMVTTLSFSWENICGTHAGSGFSKRSCSNNRIFHMDIVLGWTSTRQVNVTLFYSHWMLARHFFQGNIRC